METKKLQDNIIDTTIKIIKIMEQVERFDNKNGIAKKHYVMTGVKVILGDEVYERYYHFIDMFIDFTVSVTKGRKMNLNNFSKNYCCF